MNPGRSLFVFVLFAFAFHVAIAQESLTVGKIIDRVPVDADKTQSYSLYLPSKFDGKTKFPIIYAFDPGGRGKTAVQVFSDVAEKYGYIVVGSNDSQNGLSGDKLMPIFNNISVDTHRRFSIDDSRIVMAGFSGGARVASVFANSCKCAFAVIGSGAGFWQGVEVNNKLPFIYFGTAGYDDLNYFELRSLSEKLFAAQAIYRVEFFDGPHQWMPGSTADAALTWVELQSVRKNLRTKDDAFIESTFRERTIAADKLLSEKKFIEAEAAFRSIVSDFDGMKDTATTTEKLKTISASTDLKKALRSEKDEAADYERRSQELYGSVENLKNAETRQETLSQIKTVGDGVRSRAEAKADSSSRRTARRILDGIYISSVEFASAALESKSKIDDAINMLELADAMRPRNAYVNYLRALLYASDGQKRKAIDALSRAVDFGLKDRTRLESDKRFESIRSTPEFQSLLSRM
jgi:poly(3-hydroxybutyrate) depolymerase